MQGVTNPISFPFLLFQSIVMQNKLRPYLRKHWTDKLIWSELWEWWKFDCLTRLC